MTAQTNLPAERKAQIATGAPVAALVPRTLEEAFRLSQAMAASGMVPRGIDKPEQIMVAIMAGAELGLAPFQSLQSFAVVNGRPTLWGDGLMAVVRARGVQVREWLDGEGDAMVAHCEARRPDTGEVILRHFTVAQAKKAGLWGKQGPWQQYPERMLQMRARALALRDGCADMLRGIQIREEAEDYQTVRDVTHRPAGLRERLAGPGAEGFTAAQAENDEPVVFTEQAEEVEAIVEQIEAEPDPNVDPQASDEPVADERAQEARQEPQSDIDGTDVLDWAAAFLRSLESFGSVDELREAWTARKGELAKRSEDMFRQLNKAVADRAMAISGLSA